VHHQPAPGGLAPQRLQDVGELSGDLDHQPRRQASFAQRELFQVDARRARHHQHRLLTQGAIGDQLGDVRMVDLLEHERLLLEALVKRLRQVLAGKLEHVAFVGAVDAGEDEPVGALADQLDLPIADLGELMAAAFDPFAQLPRLTLAEQIDRLLLGNIELLQLRRLSHGYPLRLSAKLSAS